MQSQNLTQDTYDPSSRDYMIRIGISANRPVICLSGPRVPFTWLTVCSYGFSDTASTVRAGIECSAYPLLRYASRVERDREVNGAYGPSARILVTAMPDTGFLRLARVIKCGMSGVTKARKRSLGIAAHGSVVMSRMGTALAHIAPVATDNRIVGDVITRPDDHSVMRWCDGARVAGRFWVLCNDANPDSDCMQIPAISG